MESLTGLASPIVIGLLLGGLYVVIALGLSLVFGVLKVINVAHGDYVVLGGYFAFALFTNLGLDPVLTILVGVPVFFCLGFLIERFLLHRAVRVSADAALIICFGLSLIIQNGIQLIWTPYQRQLTTSYFMVSWQVGPVYIPLAYVLDFAAALVVMVALQTFLSRTYLGQAITAASQDRQTAELMGINPGRVFPIAFGIALALAAVAGVFLGLTFPFTPTSGPTLLVIAFGVVILGGLGNMVGTFLGGMIFGLSQTLGDHFLGPTGQQLVPFVMVLVVLTIRPQGLFGK
jgi:branched-chain amino acid transport system permease protein